MTGEAASRGRQIELILERIDRLPTLPAIAVRLMSISSAEEADFPEVMRLIESDPTMTATILGLCRKSGRGGDRIDTVKRAVVMLGFEAVRSAALSVSVLDVMSDQAEELDRRALDLSEADDPPINRQGLWKHAVAVACASEWIARNSPRCVVKPDEAFVAGLLHDLGRMVLELVLPRASARVAAVAERRSSDSAENHSHSRYDASSALARSLRRLWSSSSALRRWNSRFTSRAMRLAATQEAERRSE
ncbi:MAG: HDOD domain-containing protein, partial [Planctomycetota bacterium]